MGFDDTGLGAAMQASAQENATKTLSKRIEELEAAVVAQQIFQKVELEEINKALLEIKRFLVF